MPMARVEDVVRVSVAKWGNSLGVRVPKDLAARVGLREGARVEMTAEDGRLVLTVARPTFTLEELLVGMTPEAMHDSFDWGCDRGREKVE
jgi:antitoxin MazE